MIVIDSSAILAILEKESDGAVYARAVREAGSIMVSAVNAHETGIVLRGRRGPRGETALWTFLSNNAVEIAPFDEPQVRLAGEAFDRYGKDIHSQARLNLCDCAAYALAKSLSVPLLFKGDDFIHTDVEVWR